jgi:hypothetical protein
MNRTWALARAGGGAAGASTQPSTTLTARDSPFRLVIDTTLRLDHIHRLRAREYNPVTDAHFLPWINWPSLHSSRRAANCQDKFPILIITLTLPTPCGR